jgi:hypothetical protein
MSVGALETLEIYFSKEAFLKKTNRQEINFYGKEGFIDQPAHKKNCYCDIGTCRTKRSMMISR